MKQQKLYIDSTNGGNGDVWMRLVALYVMAGLKPELSIHILIPKFLRALATFTFADRITILSDQDEIPKLKYSSLGFRDLISGIIKGERYILPYQRSVINDKKKKSIKDAINVVLFNFLNAAGFVNIPEWKWIKSYQGYLDVIAIRQLKKVDYTSFVKRLKQDSVLIYDRLQQSFPVSEELTFPDDLSHSVLVYPTGTSRQFVPAWWAARYLPNAYYGFFFKDSEAIAFQKLGLKVIFFYGEPGDIILLSHKAAKTITTDSFPSHLLQFASNNTTVTITEVLKSRIISPSFSGEVVDAEVKCHPCLHLDRKSHPTCAAGYTECLNWTNENYISNILRSAADVTSNANISQAVSV